MATIPNTPADIIGAWLKTSLASALGTSATVIRQADESVERGECLVVCDAQDKGDHLGIPGHVLVDIHAAVGIWVHVTDDLAATQTSTLRAAVRSALSALPQGDVTAGNGWYVRYISGWTESPATLDGNDRRVEFAADMIIQSTSI